MISNRLAASVIIGGMVLSLSWLGYCMVREFTQSSARYHTK